MQRVANNRNPAKDKFGPGKNGYQGGNLAAGQSATSPGYEMFDALQEEIAGVIEGVGIALDSTKFNQLYLAIRRIFNKGVTLVDTGAANVYTATNNPALAVGDITPGLTQQVLIKTANTGASTYSPDGVRADPIYGLGLQPLQGGELRAGATAILMSSTIPGVNSGAPVWVLLECMGGSQQVPNGTQPQHAVTLGQMKALGLGMTDVGPYIGDLNDVSFTAGFYYFNAAAANTPIPGAQGIVLHKVYGTGGFQLLQSYSNDRILWRKRAAGVWTQWNELANLDSPSFTGNPTVPTATAGANTLQAANTAFVQAEFASKFASVLAVNSVQRLANGLIIQMVHPTKAGSVSSNTATTIPFTFPTTFPNAVIGCVSSLDNGNYGAGGGTSYVNPLSTSGGTLNLKNDAMNATWSGCGGFVIAFGY